LWSLKTLGSGERRGCCRIYSLSMLLSLSLAVFCRIMGHQSCSIMHCILRIEPRELHLVLQSSLVPLNLYSNYERRRNRYPNQLFVNKKIALLIEKHHQMRPKRQRRDVPVLEEALGASINKSCIKIGVSATPLSCHPSPQLTQPVVHVVVTRHRRCSCSFDPFATLLLIVPGIKSRSLVVR
jgi:hypothetical protein